MTMPVEATIRGYRPGDEEAINAAFNEVFAQNRPLADWRWKFEPPPWSDRRWIHVAEAEGEILAHCAALPVRLRIGERTLVGGQVVDVFSRRRASLARRGPFPRLMESFFADNCGERGLAFVVGFPGDRHMRLGRTLLRYAKPQPVAVWTCELAGPGRRPLAFVRLSEGAEPAALDDLWRRSSSRFRAAAVRDGAWAGARWTGRPEVEYRQVFAWGWRGPEAWGVLRLDGKVARWVDLLWDGRRGAALAALVRRLRSLALASGAERMEAWLSGDPAAEGILGGLGWTRGLHPQRLEISAISFVADLDLESLLPALYVTMGDSDLI